jgi:hypothetical protein
MSTLRSPDERNPFAPGRSTASVPFLSDADRHTLATVLVLVGGVAVFVGSFLDYYVFSRGVTASISPGAITLVRVSGWRSPYLVWAVVCALFAAGIALLDSGWLPKPRGSNDVPYREYALLGTAGGALLLAFASGRAYPEYTFSTAGQRTLAVMTLGVGFWVVMVGAAVCLAGAVIAYLDWVRGQDADAPAEPTDAVVTDVDPAWPPPGAVASPPSAAEYMRPADAGDLDAATDAYRLPSEPADANLAAAYMRPEAG